MTTKITITRDNDLSQAQRTILVTTRDWHGIQAGRGKLTSRALQPGQSISAHTDELIDIEIRSRTGDDEGFMESMGVAADNPGTPGVSGVPRHEQPTLGLGIGISPQVQEFLDGLVESGLYGRTISEVAERLLCEKLREIAEGNMSICHLVSTSVEAMFSKLSAAIAPTSPTMPSGPASPDDCCPPGSKGF